MAVSYEQIADALRTSVKEADRLRKQNKQLLGTPPGTQAAPPPK